MMGELFDEEYMKASAAFKKNIGDDLNSKYSAWKKGTESTLDPKTVELISVAVGSALRCAYCVESHSQKAKAKGATDKEIAAVVAIAAGVAAGATTSYGVLGFKE